MFEPRRRREPADQWIGRESILRDKLEAAQKRYDFIIIDCPPSLDLIVINALVAADEVLVPLQAEFSH